MPSRMTAKSEQAVPLPNHLQEFASEFISSTRDYVFIRPEDRLLILRPNKIHHLNRTGTELLSALYGQASPDVAGVVATIAARYGVPESRVVSDLEELLRSLALVLQDREGAAPAVRRTPFGSHVRELPVLSEIALTYRCQNRCTFCYASSPDRGQEVPEMSTEQVQRVIDAIVDDARVPTVSFTGGEPTLREDLPALIAHAKGKGMRVNLITNGLRCTDEAYVQTLKAAGLDSAQVSLEGPCAGIHRSPSSRCGSRCAVRGKRRRTSCCR